MLLLMREEFLAKKNDMHRFFEENLQGDFIWLAKIQAATFHEWDNQKSTKKI